MCGIFRGGSFPGNSGGGELFRGGNIPGRGEFSYNYFIHKTRATSRKYISMKFYAFSISRRVLPKQEAYSSFITEREAFIIKEPE